MEDDSQLLDLTQWDYNDLDFRTPQLSGIDSRGKTPRGKYYIPEETIVIVSVTDRSERDLTKRFDEFNIDWKIAEEQLCRWSHLFRAGKKLRIDISFIYKEEHRGSRVVQQQGGGRGSAIARQLAQRDQLLETQEAAGQPRFWKDVYDLMRCNGNLCSGSYCYIDEQRKHIGLNTSILTKMVEYAEEGNELRMHRDMPPYILDMIYEKERLDGLVVVPESIAV
ncbi:hypothetical protein FAVG1_13143 [Fusarium avenaceum]|nr:hypothetical protein FAVG1_13143 [Fusarium avenaceum]